MVLSLWLSDTILDSNLAILVRPVLGLSTSLEQRGSICLGLSPNSPSMTMVYLSPCLFLVLLNFSTQETGSTNQRRKNPYVSWEFFLIANPVGSHSPRPVLERGFTWFPQARQQDNASHFNKSFLCPSQGGKEFYICMCFRSSRQKLDLVGEGHILGGSRELFGATSTL